MEMERVILLMGNTGGGKSTLSNSLIGQKNVFKESDNMKSQTKDCQIAEGYLFGDNNKPKIKVIDTPGFMDSSGDDDNTFFSIYDMLQNIKDTGLHLILYCLPATDLRCHKGIIDSIKQIQNLMSNEVSTRIFVVVTQLNKLRQEDLDEKCQRIKHEVPQILGDAGLQLNFDKILFYHHGQEIQNFDIEILLENNKAFIPEILEDLKKCYDPNDKEGQLKHFTQQSKQIQMLLQELENTNNERKLKEQQDQERFKILKDAMKKQKDEFEQDKKEMIERFNREKIQLQEEQQNILKKMQTDIEFSQNQALKNLQRQREKKKKQLADLLEHRPWFWGTAEFDRIYKQLLQDMD